MRTTIFSAAIATTLCAALTAAAGQAPTTPAGTPPAQPQTQTQTGSGQRAAAATGPAVMMTGCLYKEKDVPGRTPNIAEKAGLLEDYVLADARMAGQGSSTSAPEPGTSGRMYKVEGIPDSQLSALAGKRVEVSGRIDDDDEGPGAGQPTPDRNPVSPDKIDLDEFEATSIHEVAGGPACAAKPAAVPAAR